MKMKIPKKIVVSGITWKIRESADIECSGETNYEKQEIIINSNRSEEFKKIVLLHEIIHLINSELSEKEVDFLAQALYPIIEQL